MFKYAKFLSMNKNYLPTNHASKALLKSYLNPAFSVTEIEFNDGLIRVRNHPFGMDIHPGLQTYTKL